MLGDLSRIAHLHQKSVHAILNLERNTSCPIGNHRFAFHERFRHLHLEPFFQRKLQRNLRLSHQGIEQLIHVRKSCDFHVTCQVCIVL